MKAHGRDPAKFGLEGWLRFDEPDPQRLGRRRRRAGSGSAPKIVMLYPMYRMPKLDDQIETLRRFKDVAANIRVTRR